jgi:hypothetical protein
MPRKKLSRNAPSPCGSGKKYKHCCYGEVLEADLSLGGPVSSSRSKGR